MANILESWWGGFCFCFDVVAVGTTTVVLPLSAAVRSRRYF